MNYLKIFLMSQFSSNTSTEAFILRRIYTMILMSTLLTLVLSVVIYVIYHLIPVNISKTTLIGQM